MDTTPKLRPIDAPWQVCPSTPFLHLEVAEDPQTARATFAAHYGPISPDPAGGSLVERIAGGFTQVQVVDAPPRFRAQGSDTPVHGYHLVQATFTGAIEARLEGIVHETFSPYDWSGMTIRVEDVGPERYVQESLHMWVQMSRCPNPRMYEVLGATDDPRFRRWLILGEDAQIEVVAMEWEWSLGQPLRGW